MNIEIPATCIPDLNVPFDVNRDWPCKRAAFISTLNMFAADITRTERRLARTSNAYRARNLTAWIADAETRLAKLVPLADDKPCTCKESGLYG